MQNNKVIKLTNLLFCMLLALLFAACNVAPLVPPADKLPVCEKSPITVRVADMPDNCVAIKEAKIMLTNPKGECTTEVWKSCDPTAVSFDFNESGCYKFCVEITGNNGTKFYYTGSFPLNLKEKYNVEVRFEKGVISVVFTKITPEKPLNWTITAIPNSGENVYKRVALAFDKDNNPNILYHKGSGIVSNMIFRTKRGNEWTREVVDPHAFGITEKAISYDSSGDPIIAYSHPGDNRILMSSKVNGKWTATKVAKANYMTGAPLAVKDSLNRTHIFFWNSSSSGSSNYGPSMSYKIVDEKLNGLKGVYGEGYSVMLEVDSKNEPAYLYYTKQYPTKPNGKTVLEFYYRAMENGVFIKEKLNLKTSPDLAINSKDMKAIAYIDNTEKKLYYAARVNGKWEIESVDAGLTYGKCSLIFDSNDRPVIAYYETVNMDLKVATKTANGWVSTTVDSEGDVGHACNIKLNRANEPVVVYFDKTAKAVKLAELK